LRFARICSSFCTGQSRVVDKHISVPLIEKALAPEVQAFKNQILCHGTDVCMFAPLIHVRWRDGPQYRRAENARLCRATPSHTAADPGCSSSCGMFNFGTGFSLSENAHRPTLTLPGLVVRPRTVDSCCSCAAGLVRLARCHKMGGGLALC